MGEERYYAAYGSNLNRAEMKKRCPGAIPVGTGYIHGYTLLFCRYLTIEPDEKKEVPVGIWQISAEDERALDEYEAYPSLYRKEYLELEIDGRRLTVLIYRMNEVGKSHPTEEYFQTCLTGYQDFGLNTSYLYEALRISE